MEDPSALLAKPCSSLREAPDLLACFGLLLSGLAPLPGMRILDFGAGSSVMLALAAYNSGTATVKRAVSRNVRDPINQRNFWYLYRARALPRETREFVPRVFAAILIGRNPQHFGFDWPSAHP